MKTNFFILHLILSFFGILHAQTSQIDAKIDQPEINRFSFIVGIGPSYITNKFYQTPTINPLNNHVVMEQAQNIRTNLTFGIVYTPHIAHNVLTPIQGKYKTTTTRYSFATFINPINLTKATENQAAFSLSDFGFGVGWKFVEDIMVMCSIEWFSISQPKEWFIDKFKDINTVFSVNNAEQLSFDPNDKNLFENKVATSIGFKVCYTFNVIKKFKRV